MDCAFSRQDGTHWRRRRSACYVSWPHTEDITATKRRQTKRQHIIWSQVKTATTTNAKRRQMSWNSDRMWSPHWKNVGRFTSICFMHFQQKTHQPVHWRKICFCFQNQRCMTSINLKICDFNDDPYTIIPLLVGVCIDEFCSTSRYG